MEGEEDPVAQVLHTVANPIRKSAIRALARQKMRFSQLMSACGLDYDHDAGHFNYHLSDLIEKGMVEKTGSSYRLTELGSKMAEMVDYLEKESSFLFPQTQKGGARKVKAKARLVTRWVTEEEAPFRSQPVTMDTLVKDAEKMIPDSSERARVIRFVQETVAARGARTLVVKEGDVVQAWATVSSEVTWVNISDKATGKSRSCPKACLRLEYVAVGAWAKPRKEVAHSLLEQLLRRAKEIGSDTVQITGVEAGDSEVVQALQDMGFERISSNYTMQKTLR